MRWNCTGPRLGGGRRRRSGLSGLQLIGTLVVAGVSGYLWINVIGGDLGRGAHINAKHEDETKAAAAVAGAGTAPAIAPRAVVPGGPAAAVLPGRRAEVGGVDPVARALVAAARDTLARKVTPTMQAVEDPRANSGSSFDLIDRGLGDQLPLRAAIARHRSRDPHAYGLRTKPAASMDEHRRAQTVPNLIVFLSTYATVLESASAEDRDLEAGDIVVVARRTGQGPLLAAVVSDVTDDAGNAQIIVLDPAARVPRELNPQGTYVLRHHFRLHLAQIERARANLDLNAKAGTAL